MGRGKPKLNQEARDLLEKLRPKDVTPPPKKHWIDEMILDEISPYVDDPVRIKREKFVNTILWALGVLLAIPVLLVAFNGAPFGTIAGVFFGALFVWVILSWIIGYMLGHLPDNS